MQACAKSARCLSIKSCPGVHDRTTIKAARPAHSRTNSQPITTKIEMFKASPTMMHSARRLGRTSALKQNKGFGVPVKAKNEVAPDKKCPCGSGAVYEACCSPFHSGAALPETPEQLLRSRFSAYVCMNPEYIADTTHKDSNELTDTRATHIRAVKATQRRMDCRTLEILKQEEGQNPQEWNISFKVSYVDRSDKSPELINRSERSRFLKEGGQWQYLESDFEDDKK